jgi:tricarballylate dehydrogenase
LKEGCVAEPSTITSDVVVVGAGNAALCAALSAAEAGASVTVVERAPVELHGGNTAFTGGGYRCTYTSEEDIWKLIPEMSESERQNAEFGSYPRESFLADLAKVTEYRCDPELADILVSGSFDTCLWLREQGMRYIPAYKRHATGIGGKFRFHVGVVLEVPGGGQGIVQTLFKASEERGVRIIHNARAYGLEVDRGRVTGVHVQIDNEDSVLLSANTGVVLGCGGFEANAAWRVKYLGPGWDLAKVRGTRYNTGDGLKMALENNAQPFGNWSGCHAVAWDINAPLFGDINVGDGFSRHSYPLGITVNSDGKRWFDEGEDLRPLTYAKRGRQLLQQPGQVSWQIFDAKVSELKRSVYKMRGTTKMVADSIEELATKLEREGVKRDAFMKTVNEFNDAVEAEVPDSVAFDPDKRDGRSVRSLDIPKLNWANVLDTPPFEAYTVTTGVTFTFGGVRIDANANVIDNDGRPIKGLYACGEMVGGIFYFNYAGGSGLMSGAVFGRIAGRQAAAK